MISFKKQIVINSAKENVWNVLANIGDVYKFHPGVEKSYCTTNKKEGLEAARVCEVYPSTKVLETVKEWEQGQRYLLEIDPIEKAPPVKNFTAEVQVKQLSKEQTQVSLIMNYDMKLGILGQLMNKLMIEAKFQEAINDLLKGLKIYMEEGKEVKDVKALKTFLQN